MTYRIFSMCSEDDGHEWWKITKEVCVDHEVHMTIVHEVDRVETYHKLKFCDKSCVEVVHDDLELQAQKLVLQFIEGKAKKGKVVPE